MGASVGGEYYCSDNTWELKGTNCVRETQKVAVLYADINLYGKINRDDVELLEHYVENNTKVDYEILSKL